MDKNRENNGAEDAKYEYLVANIKSRQEPLYSECYEGLGWALASPLTYYANSVGAGDEMVEIKYRRLRKLPHRSQLCALQRQCEAVLQAMQRMEGQSDVFALICSLTIGVVGAVLLAGGIVSFTNQRYVACVLFTLIGLVGCLFAYPVSKQVRRVKANQLRPAIEMQHAQLMGLLAQAQSLLSATSIISD